jgi:hypothetical protein
MTDHNPILYLSDGDLAELTERALATPRAQADIDDSDPIGVKLVYNDDREPERWSGLE